jgi:hypothetical protein
VRKIIACKLVNGKIQDHDSVATNKMGFTSKRLNNDLLTIDQYGVISKFQMAGTNAGLPISNTYSPKVISSTQGNVRTLATPTITRPMQNSVYSNTNTLTVPSSNYTYPVRQSTIV